MVLLNNLTNEQLRILFQPLFYQLKDWLKLVNIDPISKKEATTKVNESLNYFLDLFSTAPQHSLAYYLNNPAPATESFNKDLEGIVGLLAGNDKNFSFLNKKVQQILTSFLEDIVSLLPKDN